MMDKAIGRLIDNLYRPDGSLVVGHVLGIALTLEGPEIGQLQVIQTSLMNFIVKITDRPQPSREIFEFINQKMHKIFGDTVTINIEVVKEIPKEKSGKVRFTKCEIDKRSGNNA